MGNENNPWSSITEDSLNQFNTSLNAGITNIPKYDNNLQLMQNQFYAQSQYPTFPNSSGIGSQNPFPQTRQEEKNPQSITDRGLSPYSLIGESNTR